MSNKSIAVTWDDIEYKSKTALSIAKGVTRQCVSYWLKRGYQGDSDIQRTESRPARQISHTAAEIPLTRGHVALVDMVDVSLASSKWAASQHKKKNRLYISAYRTTSSNKRQILARVVMERILNRELRPSEFVDHIDGNPLNNCRSNLRLATRSQNRANSFHETRGVSGFKGVNPTSSGRWWARICANGEEHYLGIFDTPEEAHDAYCKAAVLYFGEFARFE